MKIEIPLENSLLAMLQAQQDEYRYLLLDPLKTVSPVNPLHLSNLCDELGEKALFPVLRRDLAHSPQECPQLVLLAAPGERCDFPWLAETENYARSEVWQEKRYLCAWLSSAMPPEQLATTLAAQCSQLTDHRFIPLFEPLRFELLQATASSPEALAGTIWPVSHWGFMKFSGEIACQTGKASEAPWSINWGVESVQQDIRPIWQLLLAWHRVNPLLPSDAAIQAANAWRNTTKTGLTAPQDRHYLALNRLTLPVDIEQHPAVRQVLQQVIADPSQRFIPLLRALPDTVWLELENSITTPQHHDEGSYRHGA